MESISIIWVIIIGLVSLIVVVTFFILCWTIAQIREDTKKIFELLNKREQEKKNPIK